MNTIKRDVYVLRNTIKIPIEVTKGTDMLGLEFAVRDYEIPATAAAVAYVYHKSMDKPKGTLCDVDNSVISFTPSGDFFAVGMNELQIRVINDGKSLISFKETIKCSDTMGFPDDEEEKQKTLVEQLLTKVGKEEGDRKTADDTEREERIAADDAEKKARIAEENARAEADEAIRANRIVTLDEIDLVTEEGFFVDALAVKELNSKLSVYVLEEKECSPKDTGENQWKYRKWSNGSVEIWRIGGNVDTFTVSRSSANGIYYSDEIVWYPIDMPLKITKIDQILATIDRKGNDGLSNVNIVNAFTENGYPFIKFIITANRTGQFKVSTNFYIQARWK